MRDPEVLEAKLRSERAETITKAWEALAHGKLWMFGYWAAKERQLSSLLGEIKPSPWGDLVRRAKEHQQKALYTSSDNVGTKMRS